VDADDVDGDIFFQQQGVTAQTARDSMDCVKVLFFRTCYFYVLVKSPGQPSLLTSLCLVTFFGDS